VYHRIFVTNRPTDFDEKSFSCSNHVLESSNVLEMIIAAATSLKDIYL